MEYALIQDNKIVNIILWDGNTENWQPELGVEAVPIPEDADARIGGTYADGKFTMRADPQADLPTTESEP